jgi:hypothetical protein
VASRFFEYVETRSEKFSGKQESEALEICRSWLTRIDTLPPNIKRNKLVREARSSIADSHDYLASS